MTRTVRLSAAVMAHPSRRPLAEALIRLLDGVPALVLDPSPAAGPDTLRTAIRAWEAMAADATHHLVLQDDVRPAPGFLGAARRAAERMPDALLSFYANWTSLNGAVTRLAARCGRAWGQLIPSEYVPSPAVLMPRSLVAAFLAFARDRGRIEIGLADDEVMAAFSRKRSVRAYVAAPNLVEHLDLPSLTGNGYQGARRSACFVGSCQPHSRAGGALGLADLPGVALYLEGEPFSGLSEGPSGWCLSHWWWLMLRLELDEAALWRAFARARAALPPAVRRSFKALDGRPISSLWISAYLEGSLAARLKTAVADGEVLRSATERMILGGLSRRLPEAILNRHLPLLARFAETAIGAAMAAPDATAGERQPAVWEPWEALR